MPFHIDFVMLTLEDIVDVHQCELEDLGACGEMNLVVLRPCRVCANSPLFECVTGLENTDPFILTEKGYVTVFVTVTQWGFPKK